MRGSDTMEEQRFRDINLDRSRDTAGLLSAANPAGKCFDLGFTLRGRKKQKRNEVKNQREYGAVALDHLS